MIKHLIPLLLLLLSCGKYTSVKFEFHGATDPTFHEYIEEFQWLTQEDINTPIIFGRIPHQFTGVCYNYPKLKYRIIKINKDRWETLSRTERLILIWHELAHCEYGLTHNTDTLPGTKVPKSIMYPILINELIFQHIRHHYELELLDQITKSRGY